MTEMRLASEGHTVNPGAGSGHGAPPPHTGPTSWCVGRALGPETSRASGRMSAG